MAYIKEAHPNQHHRLLLPSHAHSNGYFLGVWWILSSNWHPFVLLLSILLKEIPSWTLMSKIILCLKQHKKKKAKWLPALLLCCHIYSVLWMVQIPLSCSRTGRHAPAADRMHQMFFAHLQHLCWTCPALVMLCLLHPPCTPPCIHSNTHTCTKYVSCSILATGKVITERAKELACCRATGLVPALRKQEGQGFHITAQHNPSVSPWFFIFFYIWDLLFSKLYRAGGFSLSKTCLFSQVTRLQTKRKDESVV